MIKKRKILKALFLVILLSYFIYLLVNIASHGYIYQWDFKTYYYAGHAHARGLNPYGLTNLSQLAKTRIHHRFLYPPLTLWFFRIFSLFDFKTAFYLFLIFKCILLTGLLYLWKKEFLKFGGDILFYFFCLFAFNNAIYIDLVAGNISILQQFILWLALFFFLKRRFFLFCIFIIILASFKIVPILFLLLLWFLKEKKKIMYFFGSTILFVAIQAISYFTSPLYKDFLIFSGSLGKIGERGFKNPSTLALLKDLFQFMGDKTGITLSQSLQIIVFLAVIVSIILLTLRAFIFLKFMESEEKQRILIFLFCLAYALILPRFKDYAYILLLVPTYFAIKKFSESKSHIFLFIIIILSASEIVNLPGFNVIYSYMWNYFPLFIAYGIWILYLNKIFITAKKPATKS